MSPTKVEGARHVVLLMGVFIALLGLISPVRFDRLSEYSFSESPWSTLRIVFWIAISAYALFSKNFAAVAAMGFGLISVSVGAVYSIYSYNRSASWLSQLVDGVDRPGNGLLYLSIAGVLLLVVSFNPLWTYLKDQLEAGSL